MRCKGDRGLIREKRVLRGTQDDKASSEVGVRSG
jgi:hypothetical protein